MMDDVLAYLGQPKQAPSLVALDALVTAYIRRVPWESASRIVRRANTTHTADCPRWPEIFWQQALAHGTGGTCFESNYAFFTLLKFLGYEGYLTINNMHDSIGCHTAIVIELNDRRYLVDVGLPLHLPVPLNAARTTRRESHFHTYSVVPEGPERFIIRRDRHPRTYCFDLIDKPVDDLIYQQAITNDYGESGLFLDHVIVVKVVDENIWRFNAEDQPYHLEQFIDENKVYHLMQTHVAKRVAQKFSIDQEIIHTALNA